MRFLRLSGHEPNLDCCVLCRRDIDGLPAVRLGVDVPKGGIACPACLAGCDPATGRPSPGKLVQMNLEWVQPMLDAR